MSVPYLTCKQCIYRSAGHRCQNVKSHNYARLVSIWNACDWWEEHDKHQRESESEGAGGGDAGAREADQRGIPTGRESMG